MLLKKSLPIKYFFPSFLSLSSTLIHVKMKEIDNNHLQIYLSILSMNLICLIVFSFLKRKFPTKMWKKIKLIFFIFSGSIELSLFFYIELPIFESVKFFEKFIILNRFLFLTLKLLAVSELLLFKNRNFAFFMFFYFGNISIDFFCKENDLDVQKILIMVFGAFSVILCFRMIKNESSFKSNYFLSEILKNSDDSFFIIKSGKNNKIIFAKGEIFENFQITNLKTNYLEKNPLNELFFRINDFPKKRSLSMIKQPRATNILSSYKETSEFTDFNLNNFIDESSKEDDKRRKKFKFKVTLQKNGEKIYLLKVVKKVKKNGSFFIFNLIDCSQHEENRSYKRIIESNQRFFCSFSHELKTPINGVLPILEKICLNNTLNKENTELLNISLGNLKLLHNSIDNIINFYLFESDQIFLSNSTFFLEDLIEEIHSVIYPMTKIKKIEFSISKSDGLESLKIDTDYVKLRQILLNILSNAIQFTLNYGFITLSIRLIESQPYRLKFIVEDSGIGMSERKLNEINKKLKNDDVYDTQINTTGSCLGLIISQRLALLLGEKNGLRIASDQKKGSSFEFMIEVNNIISKNFNDKILTESLSSKTQTIMKIVTQSKINTLLIEEKKNSHRSYHEQLPISSRRMDFFEKLHCCYNFNDTIKFLGIERKQSLLQLREDIESYGSVENLRSERFMKQPKFNSDLNLSKLKLKYQTATSLKRPCNCKEILAVDDDAFNLLSIKTIMSSFNLKCSKAANGQEAIQKILERKPCPEFKCQGFRIIFMDYQMPLMDGVETAKEIIKLIEQQKINTVPIVGCTAFVSKDKVMDCLNAGMKDVIFKPLTKNIIKNCLEKWVN